MARKAYHLPLFFLALLRAPTASALNPTIATMLIVGNSTVRSPNRTFELGFVCPNDGVACFLAIWYASLPIRIVVWVANRAATVHRRIDSPSTILTHLDGRLTIADSSGSLVWISNNPRPASVVRLLDSGNFLLLSPGDATVWQSFDHPADTWLPDKIEGEGKGWIEGEKVMEIGLRSRERRRVFENFSESLENVVGSFSGF